VAAPSSTPSIAPVPPAEPARESMPASTPIAPESTTLEDLVSRVSPAVVTIEAGSSRGSGFFVAPDTILTNVHVVTSATSVTIRRPDGAAITARVESQSASYDIAVLKLPGPVANQAIIRMGSAAGARVGQEVIAIGTPLGFLQNTVSRGIVSALREVDGATMIQTDAAINPGNSGGPLLDRTGTAIGIIKSGYNGRNGLSFAVAIDHARTVLDGRPAPAPNVAAATSQYQALSPAVASPADQRRNDGAKIFEETLAQLGRRADLLDDRWRNFRKSCYEGRITGAFDREWFALWEPRAMQGAVSPGCSAYFGEIRQVAFAIRDAVIAADEAARRADVYPGARRDALHHYRLDYAGWGR
jgi:S1-C subfamily serine protease